MRKDGSKALGGERLSETQKGTVQLRREPPDFVPVVKQIITRPREGRVPSAILGGNTSFAARKRLVPSCKRACRLQCRARLQMWPWCNQQHSSL